MPHRIGRTIFSRRTILLIKYLTPNRCHPVSVAICGKVRDTKVVQHTLFKTRAVQFIGFIVASFYDGSLVTFGEWVGTIYSRGTMHVIPSEYYSWSAHSFVFLAYDACRNLGLPTETPSQFGCVQTSLPRTTGNESSAGAAVPCCRIPDIRHGLHFHQT